MWEVSMSEAASFFAAKLAYETDSWDLVLALEEGAAVVVVDARSSEAFAREHLPGAISFPHRLMNEESTSTLDRHRRYVVYCDGIGCNASTKGSLKLAQLGFDVRELIGGLDWWKRDGYATEGSAAQEGRRVVCGCA